MDPTDKAVLIFTGMILGFILLIAALIVVLAVFA